MFLTVTLLRSCVTSKYVIVTTILHMNANSLWYFWNNFFDPYYVIRSDDFCPFPDWCPQADNVNGWLGSFVEGTLPASNAVSDSGPWLTLEFYSLNEPGLSYINLGFTEIGVPPSGATIPSITNDGSVIVTWDEDVNIDYEINLMDIMYKSIYSDK